uniref:Uncharacterized protein n=1 Tax=Rhabditophanes sp. KR3021 TaxID=114890 RepID=A0AC35U0S4_9BILA
MLFCSILFVGSLSCLFAQCGNEAKKRNANGGSKVLKPQKNAGRCVAVGPKSLKKSKSVEVKVKPGASQTGSMKAKGASKRFKIKDQEGEGDKKKEKSVKKEKLVKKEKSVRKEGSFKEEKSVRNDKSLGLAATQRSEGFSVKGNSKVESLKVQTVSSLSKKGAAKSPSGSKRIGMSEKSIGGGRSQLRSMKTQASVSEKNSVKENVSKKSRVKNEKKNEKKDSRKSKKSKVSQKSTPLSMKKDKSIQKDKFARKTQSGAKSLKQS